ncbi:putative enoyl-CoA hydratase echA8 [Stieleria maiorica]|uniref:Putative enoyl-CoA hydratase echA8 n=1 Tax=Stieleria maiorica TaxID=2795974 RepID=A0A5B9MLL0_9BACT|nr:enoyl-CoA hydratase/isomerase family protein [Stieleria maiorica]QEG00891.1 putative enoyl-CoA hydratase echA8 [Stieleria maiorica]
MQHVELTIVDQIATLALNRPQVCNALDSALITDLAQALSDVHQERRVSAVLITGKGDHFCSGVDLKAFAKVAELEPIDAQVRWFESWRELTELCETILRFPKPVVAAVDGQAIGAGLAVALAADMIVMSDRAFLTANAAERGLIGGLTAPLLSFRFGAAIAARMLLTGSPIEAAEAYRLGMCCEVVSPDQIWVTASDWAKRCGAAPRESLQATKRMLNEGIGEALLTNLTNGAATGATLCNTESAAEGIRAFVEKRIPQWP